MTGGTSRAVALSFLGGCLGGGSPAGGGSRGSDISGSREGGSSTGGFLRRSGGSRLGAGGRFADLRWTTSWIGRTACRLKSRSLFIVDPQNQQAAPTGDKNVGSSSSERDLRFAHLKVIYHLLNAVYPTRQLFGSRLLFGALYRAVQVNHAICRIHIDTGKIRGFVRR